MDDRRAAVLERLADHMLAEGIGASSLRPLAKAAQTSDRMLLYYFKDKAELTAATLDVVVARLVAVLGAQPASAPLPYDKLLPKMAALVLADDIWPYMRLWLEVASLAARGDVLFQAIGEKIGRGFLAWDAAQLDSATPEAREADAARLLVTIEGMVLLKSIGMEDVCRQV
jgi:AcrR family transcriptional regulator